MEILFEENKIFFNIDYNGKNIYEWNFDIYSVSNLYYSLSNVDVFYYM